jgi:hypothetical protein
MKALEANGARGLLGATKTFIRHVLVLLLMYCFAIGVPARI